MADKNVCPTISDGLDISKNGPADTLLVGNESVFLGDPRVSDRRLRRTFRTELLRNIVAGWEIAARDDL